MSIIKTATSKDENSLSGLRIATGHTLKKEAIEETNKALAKQAAELANDVRQMELYTKGLKNSKSTTDHFNKTLGQASKSAQDQDQALRNGTMSAEVYEKQQKAAAVSTKGLGTASKAAALGMKALSIAGNMLAGIGIGLAINGLITLFDNLANYQEKLVESANKLSEEYKQLQSDVTSLQEQLKANQTKIDEINKNPLDIIGKETLKTLQLENVELERQLALATKLSDEKKKEAGEAAYKALSNKDTSYGEVRYSDFSGASRKQGTYGEAAQYNIDKIKELNNEILSLDNTSKKYEKSKADLQRQIGYENDELVKNVKNINNLTTQLDLTNPSQKELYNNLTAIQNSYLALDTLSPDLNTFEEIFDTKATSEQKDKLFELAKQGKLTAESFKANYGMLSVLFESIGLSIDDVIDKITGLSQASNQITSLSTTLQPLNITLTDIADKTNILATAWKEMDDAGELSIGTISKMIEQAQ